MPERWQHELRKLKTLDPPADLWDRATQGPQRPGRRPARAHRAWPAIAAALAVAAVAVGALFLARSGGAPHPATPRRPAQITLRMWPVAPLSLSACLGEAEHFGGYTSSGAQRICPPAQQQSRWIWYRAVLTNRGQGAYPACQATGFDAQGKAVVRQWLFFQFGGAPAGLFAYGHRSTEFYWYLPKPKHGTVVRYAATCVVNPHPPI